MNQPAIGGGAPPKPPPPFVTPKDPYAGLEPRSNLTIRKWSLCFVDDADEAMWSTAAWHRHRRPMQLGVTALLALGLATAVEYELTEYSHHGLLLLALFFARFVPLLALLTLASKRRVEWQTVRAWPLLATVTVLLFALSVCIVQLLCTYMSSGIDNQCKLMGNAGVFPWLPMALMTLLPFVLAVALHVGAVYTAIGSIGLYALFVGMVLAHVRQPAVIAPGQAFTSTQPTIATSILAFLTAAVLATAASYMRDRDERLSWKREVAWKRKLEALASASIARIVGAQRSQYVHEALKRAPCALLEVTATGIIKWASEGVLQTIDVDTVEMLVGIDLVRTLHPRDAAGVRAVLKQLALAGTVAARGQGGHERRERGRTAESNPSLGHDNNNGNGHHAHRSDGAIGTQGGTGATGDTAATGSPSAPGPGHAHSSRWSHAIHAATSARGGHEHGLYPTPDGSPSSSSLHARLVYRRMRDATHVLYIEADAYVIVRRPVIVPGVPTPVPAGECTVLLIERHVTDAVLHWQAQAAAGKVQPLAGPGQGAGMRTQAAYLHADEEEGGPGMESPIGMMLASPSRPGQLVPVTPRGGTAPAAAAAAAGVAGARGMPTGEPSTPTMQPPGAPVPTTLAGAQGGTGVLGVGASAGAGTHYDPFHERSLYTAQVLVGVQMAAAQACVRSLSALLAAIVQVVAESKVVTGGAGGSLESVLSALPVPVPVSLSSPHAGEPSASAEPAATSKPGEAEASTGAAAPQTTGPSATTGTGTTATGSALTVLPEPVMWRLQALLPPAWQSVFLAAYASDAARRRQQQRGEIPTGTAASATSIVTGTGTGGTENDVVVKSLVAALLALTDAAQAHYKTAVSHLSLALGLARLKGQYIPVHPVPHIDVRALFAEAADTTRQQLAASGVARPIIRMLLDEELPVALDTDPLALRGLLHATMSAAAHVIITGWGAGRGGGSRTPTGAATGGAGVGSASGGGGGGGGSGGGSGSTAGGAIAGSGSGQGYHDDEAERLQEGDEEGGVMTLAVQVGSILQPSNHTHATGTVHNGNGNGTNGNGTNGNGEGNGQGSTGSGTGSSRSMQVLRIECSFDAAPVGGIAAIAEALANDPLEPHTGAFRPPSRRGLGRGMEGRRTGEPTAMATGEAGVREEGTGTGRSFAFYDQESVDLSGTAGSSHRGGSRHSASPSASASASASPPSGDASDDTSDDDSTLTSASGVPLALAERTSYEYLRSYQCLLPAARHVALCMGAVISTGTSPCTTLSASSGSAPSTTTIVSEGGAAAGTNTHAGSMGHAPSPALQSPGGSIATSGSEGSAVSGRGRSPQSEGSPLGSESPLPLPPGFELESPLGPAPGQELAAAPGPEHGAGEGLGETETTATAVAGQGQGHAQAYNQGQGGSARQPPPETVYIVIDLPVLLTPKPLVPGPSLPVLEVCAAAIAAAPFDVIPAAVPGPVEVVPVPAPIQVVGPEGAAVGPEGARVPVPSALAPALPSPPPTAREAVPVPVPVAGAGIPSAAGIVTSAVVPLETTLPAALVSPGPAAVPVPVAAAAKAPIEPLNLHVLLVDDEQVNRQLGGRMLHRLGCTFDTLEDGIAVQPYLQGAKKLPDVIVLDIYMQFSDGGVICQQLRSMGYRIPMVAMTGQTALRDVTQLMAAGFDVVLHKPFDIKALSKAIQEAIARRSQPGGPVAAEPAPAVVTSGPATVGHKA